MDGATSTVAERKQSYGIEARQEAPGLGMLRGKG